MLRKPDGLLFVNKPQAWTSFDVVGKLRATLEKDLRTQGHVFSRKKRLKVGHGGTLDPLATGLMVVGVGSATKVLAEYLSGVKGYSASALLGEETDTQDSEGTMLSRMPTAHVTKSLLEQAALGLTGDIMQRPPIYSALKKDGKRMYDLAREGKITEDEVELRPARVDRLHISRFDASSGELDLDILCGGGVYVRTLIVDLARASRSAAHMTALRRTRVGPFCIDPAWETLGAALVRKTICEESFGDAEALYDAMLDSDELLHELGLPPLPRSKSPPEPDVASSAS